MQDPKIRNKDRQRRMKSREFDVALMGGAERWHADGVIKAMSGNADGKIV